MPARRASTAWSRWRASPRPPTPQVVPGGELERVARHGRRSRGAVPLHRLRARPAHRVSARGRRTRRQRLPADPDERDFAGRRGPARSAVRHHRRRDGARLRRRRLPRSARPTAASGCGSRSPTSRTTCGRARRSTARRRARGTSVYFPDRAIPDAAAAAVERAVLAEPRTRPPRAGRRDATTTATAARRGATSTAPSSAAAPGSPTPQVAGGALRRPTRPRSAPGAPSWQLCCRSSGACAS